MGKFYIFRDIETFSVLHILSEFSLNANLTSSRIYHLYMSLFYRYTRKKKSETHIYMLEMEKLHAKKKISKLVQFTKHICNSGTHEFSCNILCN